MVLARAVRIPVEQLADLKAGAVYLVVVAASLGVGASAAGGNGLFARASMILLGLVLLGIAMNVHPEKLFIAWLVAAPFLQASLETGLGKILNQAVYLVPPLLLTAMAMSRRLQVRLTPIDIVPGLFGLYALVSAALISSEPPLIEDLTRVFYVTVAIGILMYYFLLSGAIVNDISTRLAGALIWSSLVISAMAIVEGFIGWNLWRVTAWQGDAVARSIATLANPAVLGTFVGSSFTLALAVLFWNGPSQLRRPSLALVVLAIPALFFTYTRGPILAVAVVSVIMTMIANRARWPSMLLLLLVAASLYATWDRISSTTIYEARLSKSDTAETRLLIQKWSFRLIEENPVVGTGLGSFDRVKNETEFTSYRDIPEINGRANTSHNSFLTILVELGFVGLALYLLSWVVIGWRAAKAARARLDQRWILGGIVAILSVYMISASTFDVRFFSFVPALPWIVLGLARRIMDETEAA